MSTDKVTVLAIAMVFFGAIGGCTAGFINKQNNESIRSCIEAKMEWRDGSCVQVGDAYQ